MIENRIFKISVEFTKTRIFVIGVSFHDRKLFLNLTFFALSLGLKTNI